MQRMVMLRLLDDDDCNSSYILQPICVAQLLPLIKLKTNALSIKYENDNSLEMSKLDYKFIKLPVSQI